MSEKIYFKGFLKGHGGWVTSIAAPIDNSDTLVTSSRDKTCIVWHINGQPGEEYGYPKKALRGHSHFVQDVILSSDAQYAVSASWDNTLRLWELKSGETTRRFVGHEKDVMSVAFSADHKQIFSASRDKTVKVWNTIGECKHTFGADNSNTHKDWVSCVKFSINPDEGPIFVTAGWDKLVKIWGLDDFNLKMNLAGHTGYINTVAISPDGSLCATGGKGGVIMLWDLGKREQLYSLNAGETINSLVFSPNRYWLCAATAESIKIWDLEKKEIVAELVPFRPQKYEDSNKTQPLPACISLAWSHDGTTLYSGYTDNLVRVWGVEST
eukprot:gb/GECH01011271.1/.p1 GENE.gb/GECH01011271.1/~~gb/GECH01011271.1/.p1  ORF type:complete len:325 (+),score=61.81 gb/GECH01011271.1/:1-975(+)